MWRSRGVSNVSRVVRVGERETIVHMENTPKIIHQCLAQLIPCSLSLEITTRAYYMRW